MKSELFQINSSFVTESTVLLGKPQTTQMKHSLRLFKTHDSQGNPVIIVTNDLCMDALEITEIYQLRWQVELFFKWIKQHLEVKKFFGTSPKGYLYSSVLFSATDKKHKFRLLELLVFSGT